MKLIDRYIIKKFITILMFNILAFIVIFVVIDLIENLDKFLSAHWLFRRKLFVSL